MAEIIKAYKPKCCNRAYVHKSSAVRHENNCCYNKENKACATCKYLSNESNTIYNPFHNGEPGSKDYEVHFYSCDYYEKALESAEYVTDNEEHYLAYQKNCPAWTSREGD